MKPIFGEAIRAAALLLTLVTMPMAWAKAPAGRFELTGNDQVHDKLTGLFWQRNPSDQTFAWQNAGQYCTSGWRLPKIRELESIVDIRASNPALDPIFFTNSTKSASSEAFWSSSVVAGDPSYAWSVDFYYGYSSSLGLSNSNRIRCVRP